MYAERFQEIGRGRPGALNRIVHNQEPSARAYVSLRCCYGGSAHGSRWVQHENSSAEDGRQQEKTEPHEGTPFKGDAGEVDS